MRFKKIGALILGISLSISMWRTAHADPFVPPCPQPGWFPTTFGLKDHHVFWYDGFYYLISIYISPETRFAYGRSSDLCTWEELTPVLPQRTPGNWDEAAIWAPFVYEESGVYYLYYTGVTHSIAQSIMLATSTDPSDPNSWQPQGVIFQPDHMSMVWEGFDTWSDCRDPTMVKIGDVYYLYYTGLDIGGGIVGVATATSPYGPWMDWGSILTLSQGMAESATLVHYGSSYYLVYHDTALGEHFRIGPGPTGPWTNAHPFTPGWAHEIWQDQDGAWYTSFLTNYKVKISSLTWDTFYQPPHPAIGGDVYHLTLPLLVR